MVSYFYHRYLILQNNSHLVSMRLIGHNTFMLILTTQGELSPVLVTLQVTKMVAARELLLMVVMLI